MHYVAWALAPLGTTDETAREAVEPLLAPFNEEVAGYECGWWDWWTIGGRWDGALAPEGQAGGNVRPVADVIDALKSDEIHAPYRLVLPDAEPVCFERWDEERKKWVVADCLPHIAGQLVYGPLALPREQVDTAWRELVLTRLAPLAGRASLVVVDYHS